MNPVSTKFQEFWENINQVGNSNTKQNALPILIDNLREINEHYKNGQITLQDDGTIRHLSIDELQMPNEERQKQINAALKACFQAIPILTKKLENLKEANDLFAVIRQCDATTLAKELNGHEVFQEAQTNIQNQIPILANKQLGKLNQDAKESLQGWKNWKFDDGRLTGTSLAVAGSGAIFFLLLGPIGIPFLAVGIIGLLCLGICLGIQKTQIRRCEKRIQTYTDPEFIKYFQDQIKDLPGKALTNERIQEICSNFDNRKA